MSKRREISSIVALVAPRGGRPARLYARHYSRSIHAEEVIDALRYFRHRIGVPLIVVWDRLSAHQARATQDFLAAHPEDFHIEWLPSYAPELNPEEQCNQVVKAALRNALPSSPEELRRMARRQFRRLGRRPDVLRSFFCHAGLSVT